MKIKHCKQQTEYSCGAASFGMITGIPESEAVKLCKTKKSGTSILNVEQALNKLNLDFQSVYIYEEFYEVWWIKLCSYRYPIYASCNFISNSGRGRNSIRKHSIVIANGKIFDPSEDFEVDYESFSHTFNKKLIIKHALVVFSELENYGKNH